MRVFGLSRPRGKVLVLTALLLSALLGFAALSVDMGIITTARGQLKSVADAAALAGAWELANYRHNTSTPVAATQSSLSTSKATTTGQANRVLNQAAVVLASDVVVGYKQTPDPNDSTFSTADPLEFNSVRVTATRSADHVGLLPAYFSRIWGNPGTAVSVTSTATASLFQIKGFNGSNGQNSGIMPFTMLKSDYQTMMDMVSGKIATPAANDKYRYINGVVSSGSDGVPEANMYPAATSPGPGNFGTINIGTSSNSTAVLSAQIRNGVTPAQIQTEFGGNNAVVDASNPHWFGGDTGISAGMKDDLASIIGKPRTIVLYDVDNGKSGNNLKYRAIEFAPIRIMYVDLTGSKNSKTVVVQPAATFDPTGIPDTGKPGSWTTGGLIVLHLTR